ncbi:hypothetical protein SCCGRSA3_02054 [Marine Group I thaumarchaeote SCGC RSA3]|uniref:Secreted periplasmic Zn-dependent protease protein n=3 Tax=Marine Group I TaxID=905826 RepID=A0A081RNY4_9ARCH|nr:secreted periplasmic Zn-dependent protease protein [Marine Group I thaumarchaeote SCGC AAA799-N04]KFM15670.1 secreted periplasmic Zn-dependent protease protein [Marine Group I thaumarchaeote SCGC AAA799-D11]KFM16805.1 hypothetical protein SCCGRSA3_02054 [Marine Group I thaumarchaeote SCGC RSA3]
MRTVVFGIFLVSLIIQSFANTAFSETQENHLTLSSHEITKTEYSTEVKKLTVTGHILNYERGEIVHLLNVFPSGEITRLNTTGTDDGNFFTIIHIDKSFDAGEYTLILEYDGKQIASTTYVIK